MVGTQPFTAAVCDFFLHDGDDPSLHWNTTGPFLLADDDCSLLLKNILKKNLSKKISAHASSLMNYC